MTFGKKDGIMPRQMVPFSEFIIRYLPKRLYGRPELIVEKQIE